MCGLGLIGKQRLKSILESGLFEQLYVYDPFLEALPVEYDGRVIRLTEIPEPQETKFTHVVIATPHDVTLKLVEKLKNHKPRILMEKPLGRNLAESEMIMELTKDCELSIGFNYRFMAGIEKLKEILSCHELGEINSIRLDLGHGGSPKDADSWKLNKESAGGGSLLDPGIHLIDLVLFLFGSNADSVLIDGVNYWSGFWKTGIEESTMVLGEVEGIPFYLVSSIVAWRTRFSVEIIGSNGYVIINGRGRSDGPQTITVGRRWGWQNANSQIESEESEMIMMQDSSIAKETDAWLHSNLQVCSGEEGLDTMKLYHKILSKKSPHDLR